MVCGVAVLGIVSLGPYVRSAPSWVHTVVAEQSWLPSLKLQKPRSGPQEPAKFRRKDVFITPKQIHKWQKIPLTKVDKWLKTPPTPIDERVVEDRLMNQTKPSRWRTSVVLVPAVYKEWTTYGIPPWARTRDYQVHLYQRLDPRKPNFAYNFGYEAGVYLRFIVDYYHDLPNHTAFVHARPQQHNRRWLDWLKCIQPDLNYTILNNQYIKYRPIHSVGGPEKEQCWRDMVGAIGHRIPDKLEPAVGFYCCNQFVISKWQLLRYPLQTYRVLLRMMGDQPEVCHEGPLEMGSLFMANKSDVVTNDSAANATLFETQGKGNSKMAGSTFEHLQHVVFGGHPLLMSQTTQEQACRNFKPDHICNGSPCRTAEGKKQTRGCWQGKVFVCR